MKIGLLGGTFDPIHNGHLHLARQARQKLRLDKILFIPAYQPPHKIDQVLTAAHYRREMVAEAIRSEPSFELSDVELRKKGVSYTVDTLKELEKNYPRGTEFFFLTGADSVEILNHWKDPKEIFKRCHFVVARRPGFQPADFPSEIVWLDITPLEVSSTQIRSTVRQGGTIDALVPSAAARVIEREKLYRGGKP